MENSNDLFVKGVTDSNRQPLAPMRERSFRRANSLCRESRYRLLLQETYSTAIKKNY